MKNTNYLKEELYELIKTDESIFDFIQESSLDGLWYWDLERPEEEWMNPKFWSVLGYDYREMPHKASAWKDIIYAEDLTLATENFIKHCQNPEHPYDQTVRYTHKNGSTVWIRCRGLAIRDKHGKPIRMLGAHQDITETKNKELLLQMKTDQLRNAQKVSKIGSWELDLKTNEVVWTEELYNMYGFDSALPPPLYTEQMKLFTPESWQILTSAITITKEQGIPYELELTTIRKDGSHGWMWVRGEAVFDESNNILALRGVAQDISEKKKLELEKEALIKRLNYALDASGDGIWDWTPANGITVFSKAWIEMLGYEVGELASLASEWSDRLHPDDIEWVFAAINKVTQTPENGDAFSHEYRFKNKAGDYLWILNKAKVVERNEKGEATRVVGTHTNITKEKETRRQIEEAKEQAEAASKAKSEFLANMSHEIRTPMNGVLGMLELVKRTSLTHQQKDYVTKADSAARSLLGILSDILDFSKISAGKMTLDPSEFEVENVLTELGIILAGNLAAKSVEIVLDRDPHLPDLLVGDRLRLLQVLINLAGNALKFTEIGHVIIRMELLEKNAENIVMRVEVEDTGIGMSQDQQAHLFESFAQAEASTTRRYGGTGLGLVICKRLLELMGSELKLESKPNVGSRFWFDLTLGYNNIDQHDALDHKVAAQHKVLVVDDSPLIADVLYEGLTEKGWRVVKVNSAFDALAAIEVAADAGDPFDVVLMDWNMPGMNGFEASKKIRATKKNATLPQIIMITAHEKSLFNEVENAGDKPFDQLIVKPTTISRVENALLACVKTVQPAEISHAPELTSEQSLSGIKLLIVEDNELNRQVAFELLTLAGAIVDVAVCGMDGVAKVMREDEPIDVVLMDIQMPDIDGYEATRRIRTHEKFSNLAIIAMTANASESDRKACLDAGMNDHIAKPFDMNKLVPLIRHYCGIKEIDENIQPVLPQPIDSPYQEVSSPNDIELTESMAKILARFSGNRELVARMRDRFAGETEGLLAKLDEAIQSTNLVELTSVFHSFKGVSATLGAIRLANVASDLESKGRLGLWASDESITEFRNLINQSVLALEQLNFDNHTPEQIITLSADQLELLLEEMQRFLQEDNMSAMSLAEKLASNYGSRPEVKIFYEKVEALNFPDALRSLQRVKEVLLNGQD